MKQLADHHVKILYQTRIITNSMLNREVMAYLKTHKRPGMGGKEYILSLEKIF